MDTGILEDTRGGTGSPGEGNMVQYLTELLQDTCDNSWKAAKRAHSILLHRTQDALMAWDTLKDVNQIRKHYAHMSSSQYSVGSEKSTDTKVVSCFKYNKGFSTLGSDHEWQNTSASSASQHSTNMRQTLRKIV